MQEEARLEDIEIVYRRVPASANPPLINSQTRELSDQAFAPHKQRDITGLSVARAKYKSQEDAAVGVPGKSYYLAELLVSDIRLKGMDVVPRPDTPSGYDISHAEIPQLNSSNYRDDVTQERQKMLVEICKNVHGPFLTPAESTN